MSERRAVANMNQRATLFAGIGLTTSILVGCAVSGGEPVPTTSNTSEAVVCRYDTSGTEVKSTDLYDQLSSSEAENITYFESKDRRKKYEAVVQKAAKRIVEWAETGKLVGFEFAAEKDCWDENNPPATWGILSYIAPEDPHGSYVAISVYKNADGSYDLSKGVPTLYIGSQEHSQDFIVRSPVARNEDGRLYSRYDGYSAVVYSYFTDPKTSEATSKTTFVEANAGFVINQTPPTADELKFADDLVIRSIEQALKERP